MKSFYPRRKTLRTPSIYGLIKNLNTFPRTRMPSLFFKPFNTLKPINFDPGKTARVKLEIPERATAKHELELAVLVNQAAEHINKADFREYIEGYMLVFDLTNFYEGEDIPIANRKMGKCFTPISPLIPKEELGKLDGLSLRMSDGRNEVKGALSDFHYSLPEIMQYISENGGLVPGDIIMSGTHGHIVARNRTRIEGSLLSGSKTLYTSSYQITTNQTAKSLATARSEARRTKNSETGYSDKTQTPSQHSTQKEEHHSSKKPAHQSEDGRANHQASGSGKHHDDSERGHHTKSH